MKKINYLLFSIFILLGFTINVDASTTLSVSKSQVSKGSSFKVTVKATSVASWNLHMTASGPVKNCSITEADSDQYANNVTKTFSTTCKATNTGTITLKLTGDTTNTNDDNSKDISITKTVKVTNSSSNNSSSKNNSSNSNNTKTEEDDTSNKNLSSDATLKNLSISSGTLSPKFDKDTTEYKTEVENEVEKVKISASVNNKNAEVSGTGEKKLKVGKNSFGIVVEAENGKTKTYTIVVTRKEEDPVYVTIDKVKYQVVRDTKDIEIPKNYKETKITIDEKEVPAFYNDITKLTLILLRDDNNNISFYICDVDKNTYTIYQEEEFHLNRLLILDMDEKQVPKSYHRYNEMINGREYEVYKYKKSSNYSLIYALNLDTGEKHLYLYDKEENTTQIFNDELKEAYKEEYNNLFYVTIGLCGIIVLLIIIMFILLMKKKKHKKKHKKSQVVKEEEKK